MLTFPDTEKKLKSRISSYKSAMNKEKRVHGYINDGAGKRYVLFCFYFILNDLKKSEEYFEWYQKEFDDDIGEPVQKLCWAITLHRIGKESEAKYRLADLMLANLYFIPQVVGQSVTEYDIRHSTNYESIDYFESLPKEVLQNITEPEMEWLCELYDSLEFRRVRKRYIDIFKELEGTEDREVRGRLFDESRSLLNCFEDE